MSLKCVKDCWKCELEGCPYTLDVSDKIDEIAWKTTPKQIKQRIWLQSERGRECNRRGQQNYRRKHLRKYNKDHARYEWIKANTKKNGVRPTEEEIKDWSIRYDERLLRKLERQKKKTG